MDEDKLENLRRRPIHGGELHDVADEENDVDDVVAENESQNSSAHQQSLYPFKELNIITKSARCEGTTSTTFTYKKETKISTKDDTFDETINVTMTKTSRDYSKGILFVIAVIFVGAFICYYRILNQSTTTEKQKNTVDSIIIELKQNFASQLDLSMKVINASLRPVISEGASPKGPAVIVLTSSKPFSGVAVCLARKLARSLKNGSSDYVFINGKEYSEKDSDVGKEEIDKKLSSKFGEKELNVGVISGLDEIPAGIAMIFHGYCDDTNAQFRKAVYIMTVTTKEDIPEDLKYRDMDQILLNRLREVWSKDLGVDQLSSLLSRLTSSAAIVLPEKKLPALC